MDSNGSIRVTIGIPTYSRLKYLKEAVRSALAQTYTNIEILISQNPHPDPAIARTIAEYARCQTGTDARIRYQIHPKDIGAPANFNSIADAATGEYLLFIGDDDRLLPNAIETMVDAVDSDTALVFANHHVIDADGLVLRQKSIELTEKYCRNLVAAGRVAEAEIVAWQQAPCIQSALIRTGDFRRIRFRETIDVPDIEFFILLARHAGGFVFVPGYLVETRLHSDSVTGRGFRELPSLAEHLQALAVAPEVEPYKRKALATLIMGAVSICLQDGDVRRARQLVASDYFPGPIRGGAKALIMALCAGLPGNLGSSSYKTLRAFRRRRFFEQAMGSA